MLLKRDISEDIIKSISMSKINTFLHRQTTFTRLIQSAEFIGARVNERKFISR